MFLIRFLFKLFYKSLFLSLLIGVGVAAYLYIHYKPLIDFMMDPAAYSGKAQSQVAVKQVEDQPLAKNTVDARNLSIRREQVPSELSSVASMPEAQPYRARAEEELAKAKSVPLSGLLGYAQSKIHEARQKLSEASAKLAKANPQDPEKIAKVAKARSLVPQADALLNQAESFLNRFASSK